DVAARADESPVEDQLLPIEEQRHAAAAAREGRLDRIGDALGRRLAGFDAVHQHPDVLPRDVVGQRIFAEPDEAVADLRAYEAFLLESGDPVRKRRIRLGPAEEAEREPRAGGQTVNRAKHVARLMRVDLLAALEADERAGAGEQE